MIKSFIRGIFGKSSKDELYSLSSEELSTVKSIIERREEEEKMARITRVMTTDSVQSKLTKSWTVTATYVEERIDKEGESKIASIGSKSIGSDLDSSIADVWFTISTILEPFAGDLFKMKESKEKE